MAFKSYLVRQYEHGHENSFFRGLSTTLKKKLKDDALLNVLIGNLSCNGHQIDAIFISSGKIIIIDFKNYGGELTFSENNPWQINTGKDFVFVKGGGGIRNPFQQVNAYRYSLMQFLADKQNYILDANHSNFNFGHIGSLIIFHQKVTCDVNQIPQTIQKYFGIADYENCIDALIDRASNQLTLSNQEIEKIMWCLDIREENLFDEEREIEPLYDKEIPFASERLEMVRKLLYNARPLTEVDKILTYYQTLVSLERKKEPSIQGESVYPVNWSTVHDKIVINIESNSEFHVRVQQNSQLQFKKNIFVGINFIVNGQKVVLLHSIIETHEILNLSNLEIPISDFVLHSRPLEDRNYPDELIEELIVSLNQQVSFTDKIDVLRNYLGETVELSANLTLALSEESPFTSQLLSELKKISENLSTGTNLESFLLKQSFPKKSTGTFPEEDFIQITSLNANQREAVKIAFSQPITVITGPPGTGKTQVVLNILANAVVFDKKVLLASKNNQAIDNVKEKIASIMREPDFFLRFGSQTEIRDKTRPAIETFLKRIHNKSIEEGKISFEGLRQEKHKMLTEIKSLQKQIDLKESLETSVATDERNLEKRKEEFGIWSKDYEKLTSSLDVTGLDKVLSRFVVNKNELHSNYSGFGKFLFNFSNRKRFSLLLTNEAEGLPLAAKDYLKKHGWYPKIENQTNGTEIMKSFDLIIEALNQIITVLRKDEKYKADISVLENKIIDDTRKFNDLLSKEEQILAQIKSLTIDADNLGIPLFNSAILKKLTKGNEIQINRYKNYIPDNIPWRNDEIPDFEISTSEFLNTFNISAITSLSVKSAFPLANEIFDIVVIDEASQCDITSAIPLILRAKQLVVIGDPMQLKHITKVQTYEEKFILNTLEIRQNLDFVNKSLYDYCYDLSIESRSQSVLLKEHFRCHPQIIGYSNKSFYGPKMGQELDIKTTDSQFELKPNGLIWKNTNGLHSPNHNTNVTEIESAVKLAIDLANTYPSITIGITTPFSDQAKAINNLIPKNYLTTVKADTVHRFQGEEKDIMILSLVVTSNSPSHKANWINNMVPYLINVAVTRAKNTLYIIGNANYCKQMPAGSPIGQLARYAEALDRIET